MPLSDLSQQQQDAFHERLKELRMDPSKVLKKISPETHQGPVIFSADPARSSVEPHIITLTSIDEVKRLAGNADSDFETGLLEKHHSELPEWPSELNGRATSELGAEHNRRIGAAEIGYIYGYSKDYASYKHVIDQHKFPADFAVFAAEDVCIDASNSPFLIEANSGHNYGTMTICEGGYIQFEGNATLTVQKMVRSSATKCSG